MPLQSGYYEINIIFLKAVNIGNKSLIHLFLHSHMNSIHHLLTHSHGQTKHSFTQSFLKLFTNLYNNHFISPFIHIFIYSATHPFNFHQFLYQFNKNLMNLSYCFSPPTAFIPSHSNDCFTHLLRLSDLNLPSFITYLITTLFPFYCFFIYQLYQSSLEVCVVL